MGLIERIVAVRAAHPETCPCALCGLFDECRYELAKQAETIRWLLSVPDTGDASEVDLFRHWKEHVLSNAMAAGLPQGVQLWEWFDNLATQNAKQGERVAAQDKVLRLLERQQFSDDPNDWYCPMCDKSEGHTEDCELAAVLRDSTAKHESGGE